jgi:hypothetical protein
MSESSPKVNSGKKYFIRPDDVPPYHPANHSGTTNRRVICTETVGAQPMEVLLGTVEVAKVRYPTCIRILNSVVTLLQAGLKSRSAINHPNWVPAISASFRRVRSIS